MPKFHPRLRPTETRQIGRADQSRYKRPTFATNTRTRDSQLPQHVPLPTLHGITGYRPSQFAGQMGAFGRRVANTEGYDSGLTFFKSRWNEDEDTWDYRLPDTVCEALVLEQLV